MSRPNHDWWINVINMVRNYPARKQEYNSLHSQSFGVPSGMPGAGNASRTTENLALLEMPPMKQLEYEAVSQAIKITEMLPNGELRIGLIKHIYWKGKKISIDDASYSLHISEATGKRWHSAFIHLVGQCIGYKE